MRIVDSPHDIAIVGGGLAGLAVAHSLLEESRLHSLPLRRLHILDPAAPGEGGASAAAAGLLHPFSPKGRLLWRGTEGFAATRALVGAVEQHLGHRVSTHSGLLRLALTDAEQRELALSSNGDTETGDMDGDVYGDVYGDAHGIAHGDGPTEAAEKTIGGTERRWVDPRDATALALGIRPPHSRDLRDECQRDEWAVTSARQDERETCESCLPAETLGAVHVPGALSIDPPAYCRGLWSLCRSLGSAPTEASFMLVSNKSHTHV